MSREECVICGDTGFWVAYDPSTREVKCANHIGVPAHEPSTKGAESWGPAESR